jgi:hypothetical protein
MRMLSLYGDRSTSTSSASEEAPFAAARPAFFFFPRCGTEWLEAGMLRAVRLLCARERSTPCITGAVGQSADQGLVEIRQRSPPFPQPLTRAAPGGT